MSDPVTNVDVEDVLSSIRRLVSDTNSDDRQVTIAPETAEPAPDEQAAAVAQPADALILTSALRVNSTEEDSQPDRDFADMAHFRHSVSERGQSKSSETSTETSGGHSDWPSMADDEYYEDSDQPESAPVIDFIRHGRLTEPEAAPEDGAQANAAVDEGAGDNLHAEESLAEEAQVEDTQEAQTSDLHDWVDEEEHAFDLDAQDDQPADVDEQDEVEEETFVFQPEVEPEEVEAEDDMAEEAEIVSDAEETLVEETVFASAAAASVVEETDAHDVDEEEVDLADFDESVIDEDALRDLVAEIVREELTGDLGERITRNVRKLVRREIHRALMTREFE